VRLGDKDVDATEMGFQTGGEHWNEYLLSDGSVIRLKPVATEILRVDGKYDNDGNPVYIVKAANVVSVSASDKARKPPE
jgi:hypothetical protein